MENEFVKLERLMAVANSTENAVNLHPEQYYGEDEDDDEEEALSFCDLPLDHLSRKCTEEEERIPLQAAEAQEDFHFCYLSKDSEMCDVNEVFFQGQILPFRRSVSSDKGLFQYHRSISKSESIDGSSSSITLFSSRSSSISSSHRSYSSRSSAATTPQWLKLTHPPQNNLHSHRSSPPRTNFPVPGIIRTNTGICSKKTSSSSSVWKIIRLGILVTSPPEIAFHDFKTRCPIPNTNCKNFRSRNCTSRNSSNNKIISDTQKRKPRGFLIGGCNCSNDTVNTVRSRLASIKKSAREMEKQASVVQPTESPKQQVAKKHGTHYRTLEWLKQLSLEDTTQRRKHDSNNIFRTHFTFLWGFKF